jgi:hypothetical protein
VCIAFKFADPPADILIGIIRIESNCTLNFQTAICGKEAKNLLGCFKKKLAGFVSPPIFLRPLKSTPPDPGADAAAGTT